MCTVSVVVPLYNMEKFVSECVESITKQTLKNIEIIVVNDGSTDNSASIINKLQINDSRIVLINQANQGVAAARNKGIFSARGEYIAFMDPDDMYPDEFVLEKMYKKARGYNATICGGSMSHLHLDGSIVTEFEFPCKKLTFTEEGEVNFSEYQFDYAFYRFIYNRKFLIDNNIVFPLYKRFQDPPFMVNAMINAKWFYAIPDVTYQYRVGIQPDPSTWSSEKAYDMMRGMIDNIIISRKNHLADLHKLAVFHLLEHKHIIFDRVEKNDATMLELLIKAQVNIDADLFGDCNYSIEIFKEMYNRWMAVIVQRDGNAKLYSDVISSKSFKAGRVLTYIPRKIRDTLK